MVMNSVDGGAQPQSPAPSNNENGASPPRRKRRDSSIETRREHAEELDYYTHVIEESIIQYQVYILGMLKANKSCYILSVFEYRTSAQV